MIFRVTIFFVLFLMASVCIAGDVSFAFDALPDALPDAIQQEFSIDDCVHLALEQNYDIAIRSWTVTNAEARLLSERGYFEPDITGYAGRASDSDTNATTETDSGELRLNTRFVTGTEVGLYARYAGTDGDEDGSGGVGARVSQPLLRGFGIKTTKAPLLIAQRNVLISRQDFILQMINTVTQVEQSYWRLVLSRERLAVQEASLQSARELKEVTMLRAEARIMSESDTIEALAAVYEREANVMRSGEYVRQLEDTLKEELSLFQNPAYWTASIIPVTKPVVVDEDVEFLDALKVSLEYRQDYRNALLRLRNMDLSLYVAKRNLLPKLDVVLAGERQNDAQGVESTFDAASNSDNEDWSVFLQLEIPLGNKSARATREQAFSDKEQQVLQIRKLELQIIREVRRAIDSLKTNRKLVAATERAVEFEQKKLENEKIKLELGESTTDNVVRFIQSLNQARLNHVQSVIDYNLALVRLAQVQGVTLKKYGMDVE